MNKFISIIFLMTFGLSIAPSVFAETKTVVGEGSTSMCFSREQALNLARIGADNNGHAECYSLGNGWSFTSRTFAGYEQCKQCGTSDEYRCFVTQATYLCTNTKKEQEEKAAKEKADKEAKDKADKAEKDRIAKEKADKEAKDKAEKDRIAKEKADKEAKDKADKAEKDRIAKEKADKEAKDKAEKDRIAKEKADKEAKAHQHSSDPIDDAFSKLDKQLSSTRPKVDKNNEPKKAGDEKDRAAKEKADKEAKDKADKAESDRIAKEKADKQAKPPTAIWSPLIKGGYTNGPWDSGERGENYCQNALIEGHKGWRHPSFEELIKHLRENITPTGEYTDVFSSTPRDHGDTYYAKFVTLRPNGEVDERLSGYQDSYSHMHYLMCVYDQ